MVNGPTQACSAYNKLHQLDSTNWWAVFREQDLVCMAGGGLNAFDHNQYSTMLPGYLSLGSSYMKIKRIVPSPTKILCESMASTQRLEVIPLRNVKIWTSSMTMYRQSTSFMQRIKSLSVTNTNLRKRARSVSLYAWKNGPLIWGICTCHSEQTLFIEL
jgi:hypothetical protein